MWAVNPDSDTVTAVHAATLVKEFEVPVGKHPMAVAKASDNTIWVVNRDSWNISVLDPANGNLLDTITLPYASQPVGLAFTPDQTKAFVTLQALGRLVRLDPNSRSMTGSLNLGPDSQGLVPRVHAVAVNSTSTKVYATRLVSPDAGGEVYEVNPATMILESTITLANETDPNLDSATNARGIPNYLTSVTISPDGTRAWIASKKDNIDRGLARDGLDLLFDLTVRAITSVINLGSGAELLGERIDFDNKDRTHSSEFSPLGDLAFVLLPGNNAVSVVDTYTGAEVTLLNTEKTPTDAVIDQATGRLYVLNFLSRSLSVYDVEDLLNAGSSATFLTHVPLVQTELLAPDVLLGKQFFYDASSTRLNSEGYMSCASCHLDGAQDGRIWDFTTFGEGFRNTIDLRGRAGDGHGRVHWTANFDEIHDFEGQIRGFGTGTGLMADVLFNAGSRSLPLGDPKAGLSSDLDALAAYVASLDEFAPSPYRNSDTTLTAGAEAGKVLFNQMECFNCHGGEAFTDSQYGAFHDVGTLKGTSGQRLGNLLTGLDTPTLRGVWDGAPYLHDGSAMTLYDVFPTFDVNMSGFVYFAAHWADTGCETPSYCDGTDLDFSGDVGLGDLMIFVEDYWLNPSLQHAMVASLGPDEKLQLVSYLQQIDGNEPNALPPAITNFAPSIINPGNQTDLLDLALTLSLSASDPESDTMTFSASDLPDGLVIDPTTGEIAGTPVVPGETLVKITVSDLTGSDVAYFTWNITE